MTTLALNSWLIHLILQCRSLNLLLPVWGAVREPGMWQECQTLRFANTQKYIPSASSAVVSKVKIDKGNMDSSQTSTFAHACSHAKQPKKIGLSHQHTIEMLMTLILCFCWKDQEWKLERQAHAVSQIS